MKRTAAVFLASLIVVFYTMSYMRINAAGTEETASPTELTVSETLPPSVSDPSETTKIVDIPKPVQTAETGTDTVPETTETAPVTEETIAEIVVTETETAPVPAETTGVTSETTGTETEPERETVPPPETIEQETRAPKMVLHVSQDKVLAQVTVAVDPPDTVKPVIPAVTAAQAITTAGKTEPMSDTAEKDTTAAETPAAADMTILSSEPATSSNEDVPADSPHLTAGSVVVIGAGAAAITALLYFYRFARRP